MTFPELQDLEEIFVINEDALGPSVTSIVFCLEGGITQSFVSTTEHRAVMGWVKKNLPQLSEELERLLVPGVVENSEAVLYKWDNSGT